MWLVLAMVVLFAVELLLPERRALFEPAVQEQMELFQELERALELPARARSRQPA